MPKKKVSKHWTEEHARRVLEDADRSGLSDRAYAEESGLKAHRLWWWRRRLGQVRDQGKAVAFVELRSKPTPNSGPIEIRLVNGRVVSVTDAIDPMVLAGLLDAIEGRRC